MCSTPHPFIMMMSIETDRPPVVSVVVIDCVLFWWCWQMVTRTKKIFVGGLSAPSTVDDVKGYFEQFGRVSLTLFVLLFLFFFSFNLEQEVGPLWRQMSWHTTRPTDRLTFCGGAGQAAQSAPLILWLSPPKLFNLEGGQEKVVPLLVTHRQWHFNDFFSFSLCFLSVCCVCVPF